jgi:serine/threonine protein phosphatase PrpC
MTTFASGAATHVGQVRQVNQDHVLDLVDDGLFAVADGMGGHRGGEVASEVAIDALKASPTSVRAMPVSSSESCALSPLIPAAMSRKSVPPVPP